MGNETILLKFSGENLDLRSVPIYELGDTLVAVQRILHKAFLFENGRLTKHAQLTQIERKQLSLQINERRKSSDVYALIPFLSDPINQHYLVPLLKIGMGALSKYALQTVFSKRSTEGHEKASINARDIEGSLFVGAIYADTVQITNHIHNIGGVESIELTPEGGLDVPAIKFTQDTQKYVRDLANQSFRGESQEIVGNVTRLIPNRLIAEVKLAPARYVKVGLAEDAFLFVRYNTEQDQLLRFRGYPISRLGEDLKTFREFEAHFVERVRKK
jgi:hypothetical protein